MSAPYCDYCAQGKFTHRHWDAKAKQWVPFTMPDRRKQQRRDRRASTIEAERWYCDDCGAVVVTYRDNLGTGGAFDLMCPKHHIIATCHGSGASRAQPASEPATSERIYWALDALWNEVAYDENKSEVSRSAKQAFAILKDAALRASRPSAPPALTGQCTCAKIPKGDPLAGEVNPLLPSNPGCPLHGDASNPLIDTKDWELRERESGDEVDADEPEPGFDELSDDNPQSGRWRG